VSVGSPVASTAQTISSAVSNCYRHVFEVNDERIEALPGQHVSYRGVSDSEKRPSNVARPHSLRQWTSHIV